MRGTTVMNRIASSLITLLFAFSASSTFGGDKDAPAPTPSYDPKTEREFVGPISDIHEISSGALQGVYLTIKTRTDTVAVYLGPADFIKVIDVQFRDEFKNGNTVKAIGVKVKFESKDIVLAREVGMSQITLTLRDAKGAPQWLWMTNPDDPTGF
jgi:hypothetical protein